MTCGPLSPAPFPLRATQCRVSLRRIAPALIAIVHSTANLAREMLSATASELYAKKYARRDGTPTGVPENPLLYVPSHAPRELRGDLKRAGIPSFVPGEGKVDFHSCRVAYITFLMENGASVKEGQSLARHSTPGLTLNTYARTRNNRLVGDGATSQKHGCDNDYHRCFHCSPFQRYARQRLVRCMRWLANTHSLTHRQPDEMGVGVAFRRIWQRAAMTASQTRVVSSRISEWQPVPHDKCNKRDHPSL